MSYGKARASPLEEAVGGSNSSSSDPNSRGPNRCIKVSKQRTWTNFFINSLGRFSLSLSSGCKTAQITKQQNHNWRGWLEDRVPRSNKKKKMTEKLRTINYGQKWLSHRDLNWPWYIKMLIANTFLLMSDFWSWNYNLRKDIPLSTPSTHQWISRGKNFASTSFMWCQFCHSSF